LWSKNKKGATLGDFPLCVIKTATIRARSLQILPVSLNSNKEVIIHKKEIKDNVFIGESLTFIKNGTGHVPVINANNYDIILDKDTELDCSEYEHYQPMEMPNINTVYKDKKLKSRLKLLMESISLDKNLNWEEKQSIENICKDFHDIFQLKGDKLTFTDVVKHEIQTEARQPPINIRQYRLPEAHKSEINRQVREMLDDGIIAPSTSPWNSPIILVPKKAGPDGQKKWRLVVDFRKLNEVTIEQVFPIPRINEILD